MKVTELFHIIESANLLYSGEFGLDGDEAIIYINDTKFGSFRSLMDFIESTNKRFIPSFVNQFLDCDLHSQSPYRLTGEFKCFIDFRQKIEIIINRF